MEEKGCAPAIAEFAVGINRAVFRRDEGGVEGVVPSQRRGDLGVGSDRISCVEKIRLPNLEYAIEDSQIVADCFARRIQVRREIQIGFFFVGRFRRRRRSRGGV